MRATVHDRSDEFGSAMLVGRASVDPVPDGTERRKLGEAGAALAKPLWCMVKLDDGDAELVVESGVCDDHTQLHMAECGIWLVLVVARAVLERVDERYA